MSGLFTKLFGRAKPASQPDVVIDIKLFHAMLRYVQSCMRQTLASGDSVPPLDTAGVRLFLVEFVTAVLDARDETDQATRRVLLVGLSRLAFGAQTEDWDDTLAVSLLSEDMLFQRGWDGPVTPDEVLDRILFSFLAGNLAARDFLAIYRPDDDVATANREVAERVALAMAEPAAGQPLPETPSLEGIDLLRRRHAAFWRAGSPPPSPVSPNATSAQIEQAALAWLEAVRGDVLAGRCLDSSEPPVMELERLTPPLGVALVDFVLRAQYQARQAFKASARPVLQAIARRLYGGAADAVVERWIVLWKDLMLAYDGPRPASLASERRFELLAYGQTRGRMIGGIFRDDLSEGMLSDWGPMSRDVEMTSILWRNAGEEVWPEEECLAWPLADLPSRLSASRVEARALLAAAGLSADSLAAWEAGSHQGQALRAILGYGPQIFRRVEYVSLEMLPLLALQHGVGIDRALRIAASSWALAKGEGESLLACFVDLAATRQGLSKQDRGALLRLLVDAAIRIGRLQERRSYLAALCESQGPQVTALPQPSPVPALLGSALLRLYDLGRRPAVLGGLGAALAADFAAQFDAGDRHPRPSLETQGVVETILVYDPRRAAQFFSTQTQR